MANLSAGSRGRRVGLSDPRGARGQANDEEIARRARAQANDEEIVRHALRRIRQDDLMGLDVPSDSESDIDSMNLDSDSAEPSSSSDQRFHESPQRRQPYASVAAAAVAVPGPERLQSSSRNRYFWAGNNDKLNLLASKYYHQPMRQELAANASGSHAHIEEIRLLKRDPSKDLDFSNLKHSGKVFLVKKTCEELNECDEFRMHMPENTVLGVELCRQKIKEFFDVAIATPDERIDHSICLARIF